MKNKKFSSIRKNEDFSKIFSKGKTISNSVVLLKFLPSKSFKLGISVSKKISKLAVYRNKVKRQIRNIFYSLDDFQPIDLFVIVKPKYDPNKYNEMKLSIIELYSKIKCPKSQH